MWAQAEAEELQAGRESRVEHHSMASNKEQLEKSISKENT
jgi:hypothetical protein